MDEDSEFDYVEDDGSFGIDVNGEPDDWEQWSADFADFLENEIEREYVDTIETGYDIESPSG